MTDYPLSAAELEIKFDASLDPALSAHRTTHLAEALAAYAQRAGNAGWIPKF